MTRDLVESIIARSTADHVEVSVTTSSRSNLRFARNEVTTSGANRDQRIRVTCTFGTKTGSSEVNQLDRDSLDHVVKTAEALAKLSPEDPEFVPPLGPQTYVTVPEAPKPSPADAMAAHALTVIERAETEGLIAAGYLEENDVHVVVGNKAGRFAEDRSLVATLSSTLRTTDGTGSGWASRVADRAVDLDATGAADVAAKKALTSASPTRLEPGRYPAVLEPACVASFVQILARSMGARKADEGRSWFTKKLGKKVLGTLTLRSDPASVLARGRPWGTDGLPQIARTWVDGGRVKTLTRSRFWAKKTRKQAVPSPPNLLMEGEGTPGADLLAGIERGVLITSLWYIRSLNPRTLAHTGLTRDGVYLVENGVVTRPLTNFRWNDSPVDVFAGMEASGKAVRVSPRGRTTSNLVVPAIRVKGFTLSSVSEAV